MKEIVVSGMRPTGSFHLGHYAGVVRNWVELQKQYPCYFFVADWHAFTSHHEKLEEIKKSRFDYVRAWIASGVDPETCIIYTQSDIPEVLKLFQIFLCLTPPGWADRSPSWKDFQARREEQSKVLDNLGFYTYPMLQAADVAIMKGKWVPVGADQVPHIEICRDIVRKFNRSYKGALPEPEPKLTSSPKLLGPHGQKMSSSLGNVIHFAETEKTLQNKINKLVTDDKRLGVEFPGDPENCSVFEYHKVFSPKNTVEDVNQGCRGAKLSCGECKQKLGVPLKNLLMPMVEKYQKISDDDCADILKKGREQAKSKAIETWAEVAQTIGY